jgi:hypothetical protein
MYIDYDVFKENNPFNWDWADIIVRFRFVE